MFIKKLFSIVLALAILFPNIASAQNSNKNVTLDEAIQRAAKSINDKLPKGSKIAVLSYNSPSDKLSNYVLEEITSILVNEGKLTVVDRANLDRVRGELNFNLSGEVDDSSAQKIGRMLGAQSIVLGNFTEMGKYYRSHIRTIRVENASIQATASANIVVDEQLSALMKTKNVAASRVSATPTKSKSNTTADSTSSKKKKVWLWILIGLGAIITVAAIAAASSSSTTETSSSVVY